MSGEGYGVLGDCSEILEKMLQTVEGFGFEIWVFGFENRVFGTKCWVFGTRCWVFGTRSWVFGSAVGEIPTGCNPPPPPSTPSCLIPQTLAMTFFHNL